MGDGVMYRQRTMSHLGGGNAAYIEELFDSYLGDPNSVPEQWRTYFDKLPRYEGTCTEDVPHSAIREHFLYLAKNKSRAQPLLVSSVSSAHEKKQVKVLQLITAYRFRGHQIAKLDPLEIMEREDVPDLELAFQGLSTADYDTVFQVGSYFLGKDEANLKEIHESLQQTYCGSIGAEYMQIVDTEERRWIQHRLESVRCSPEYSRERKLHTLERLVASEGLEKYLGTKYPGTKRFGLEGGESLTLIIDELIQRSGASGTKEMVIGMAHRGRLNVLVNTLGKNPADLFDEFEGKHDMGSGAGDVKYHQGFSSNISTSGGEIHLALSFNPSHLEIVSPVVEGSVRARQDRRNDIDGELVVPIIIHGDSAFAGQGVVMETFQMSQTRGFKTGGTIHIVVNNQIGFTTNRRDDTRSTEYCTDVAKMVQAPIFHVNGDDPEAVLFITQVALDYRREFKKDVVIDLVCYRRHGHNEADEPSITQPLMYEVIRKHPTTRSLYGDRLVRSGVSSETEIKKMVEDYRTMLDNGEHVVKSLVSEPDSRLFVDWTPYLGHERIKTYDTTVDAKVFRELAEKLDELPEGFVLQRQVAKIRDDRRRMAAGAHEVNWGFAEIMAYATILKEGHQVRLIGQDVGRGTFSHRHAVLHNQKDDSTYTPLKNIYAGQPSLDIYDSLLSEEAVLGFEYGYATTAPNSLCIWEAQFGDFANGAQVVIDQFISAGELKWDRLCGLVMLLPHGYEGQGAEHSSARLERFLQLCAENNMQVCVPSTPAQVYHMLRRQIKRPLRKPLIVMTPKSLLRHKLATSTLEELANGTFQDVLPEMDEIAPEGVKRIVMCSGKVYYDLLEKRRQLGRDDVAIVRIEQLYPFPEDELVEVFSVYKASQIVWCQEEPMNQGAWYCSQHHMKAVIQRYDPTIELEYAGRSHSAVPAVGYMSLHIEQQEALVRDAIG
ncbi:MAG: 2-oxoglutarate dehydrogenase E1 component [Gammaproteobacteria bacterium]|nr:2-oxoglutarate dehydrogenase E1 component [Gammaproteobacteria bacterium]